MKKKKLVLFAFVLVIISTLVVFTFVDRWLIIQNQSRKADIIVCLGGGGGERLQKTYELYKKDFASLILIGDSGRSDPEVRKFFINIEKRFLVYKGVPPESILIDPNTDSTFDEALHAKNYMDSHKLHSAIVVSDPYHMRRVKYIFNKVFRGSDINLLFVPAEAKWAKGPWWANERSLVYVFNEVLKLGYYWVKY